MPQYHPTLDNDKWWGKGFTEWTNVGKAKPLFIGHYQPKVPADLGYYDLRVPEVRELQASLAKEAGIYGFCYYHYWFGNGRKELELPLPKSLKVKNPISLSVCVGLMNLGILNFGIRMEVLRKKYLLNNYIQGMTIL